MNEKRIVYSTDGGRAAPPPSRKQQKPSKPAAKPTVPDDGVVRLFREKGKRGGKTVTVIRGLPAGELESRAMELKRLCGAGGTVRDGAIEIQGDHRERIMEHLTAAGHRVKLAGG